METNRLHVARDVKVAQLSGAELDPASLEDAKAGLEAARARREMFETRGSLLLQGAALTTTLLLANSSLLVGKEPDLSGAPRLVATAGLIEASVFLIASGLYALAAVMVTFDTFDPNSPAAIEERLGEGAGPDRLASMLVARNRVSLVADWKLDRLKRAALAFVFAVLGIGFTSGALVVQALAT